MPLDDGVDGWPDSVLRPSAQRKGSDLQKADINETGQNSEQMFYLRLID